MGKKALALVGLLMLSATLTGLQAAAKLFLTQQSVGQMIISVDPSVHQDFGLAYPVTYNLSLPAGSSNLVVSVRHSESTAWVPLQEKSSFDFFNGEEVVRFDYASNAAYVSVGFDSTTDDIFIRVTDGAGQPVNAQFQNICRYYDNRQAAVTVTADDWRDLTNPAFVQAVHIFRSYRLPITTAIITGGCTTSTWQVIQRELDSGYVEAASHTRSHTDPPYADPVAEIIGSKEDLLANLHMPPAYRKGSQGYVYTWVAPYGSTTPQTESIVGQARYIVDRLTYNAAGEFTSWDPTQLRYSADGKTCEMGPLWGGLTDVNALNNMFNQAVAAGKIYHLMLHPLVISDSGGWSKAYTTGHLANISNRTNIWYTNFGTLYTYHFLQDNAPGTIQIITGTPNITVQPLDITARQKETATFSVVATGSAPLLYQWRKNGINIPGANSAIYTTPGLTQADSNAVFSCMISNSLGFVTSGNALLTVLPPIINILINSSFESGTSPWVFWTNGTGSMTQASSGTDGNKSAQINITSQGTDVQLYQSGLRLMPNTEYKLTFDAYSSNGHDFEVSLNKNATPYTNYGLVAHKFDLGLSWQSFSVTFTTTGFSSTVTDGRLWFSLALYNSAGDVYHIDNVVLARISDLYPPGAIPPSITMEPIGQTVVAGQTATFAVTATGTAPLSYQWQKNSVDIPAATSYAYTTPVTTPADSGNIFRCRITNGSGSITSSDARLTVLTPKPPVITLEPRDTTVQEGSPVQFTVVATGDTVITYQWQRNGAAITGATSPAYSITSAVLADSGAAYRCIVSNIAGKDTSRAAVLLVRPIPPTQYLVGPGPGSNNLAVSPVLYWHVTPHTTDYDLQVSTDSTFTTNLAVNDSTIADTSFQVHGLSYITRYFWRVRAIGTGGQFSAVWEFTTTVGPAATPAMVSPVNGTAGLAVASIEFTWTPAHWATTYRLQIATDSTFATGIAYDDSTLTDTVKSVSTLHTDHRYYWHVFAKGPGGGVGFSVAWLFETIRTAPLAASLVYPTNGATGMPLVGLTFRWNSVLTAVKYGFQLGTDSTFNAGLIKNDTALVDTSRNVNGLAAGTQYFWRVRARNTSGWGDFSPVWGLTSAVPLPGQVALLGPPSGTLATADSGTFKWKTPSPRADRYWFEISIDSTFATFTVVDSSVADTVKVFRPLMDGHYYWRVRGWNQGGWGPFSETRLLRVIVNSIDEQSGIPTSYALHQNYPNPFNPSTKIRFGLPTMSHARLDIYNVLGQRIATLLDERMQPGFHTVMFDASGLPSGMYIYRLITDNKTLVKKMILMK